MTVNLIDFIDSRLDEDEAQARRFDGVPADTYEVAGLEASPEYRTVYISPARVLRDVIAARCLLRLYADVADADDPDGYEFAHGHAVGLGIAARLLVGRWADHPDYRDTWWSQ
ncbi:DUF6221 family protein [Crossiella sp. CA198]|uniref:DUF6221 family protein n=1 Tax=Crossiella sp. CA198 TaxID=3455607 RepID=UPI003F8D3446